MGRQHPASLHPGGGQNTDSSASGVSSPWYDHDRSHPQAMSQRNTLFCKVLSSKIFFFFSQQQEKYLIYLSAQVASGGPKVQTDQSMS